MTYLEAIEADFELMMESKIKRLYAYHRMILPRLMNLWIKQLGEEADLLIQVADKYSNSFFYRGKKFRPNDFEG